GAIAPFQPRLSIHGVAILLKVFARLAQNQVQNTIEVVGRVKGDFDLAFLFAVQLDTHISLQVPPQVVLNPAYGWVGRDFDRGRLCLPSLAACRPRLAAQFPYPLLELADAESGGDR